MDAFGRKLRARRLRRLQVAGKSSRVIGAMYGLSVEQVEEEIRWVRRKPKQPQKVAAPGVPACPSPA